MTWFNSHTFKSYTFQASIKWTVFWSSIVRGQSEFKGAGGCETNTASEILTWYACLDRLKPVVVMFEALLCVRLKFSLREANRHGACNHRIFQATVFWDSEGLLLCEFLEPRTTINSARYCETLEKLHTAIRRKRPGRLQQGVKLLHDGARPHTSNQTKEWLQQRNWEVLQHPPYSPDLAPSDFHLFAPLKKFLAGKRFASQHELQDTVVDYLQRLDRQHYREGMFKLVSRWDKCLNRYGDYVEK